MLASLRIFLASPGDVPEERHLARKVIAELAREPQFRDIGLETISWDDPHGRTPIVAQLDPQTAIERGLPRPSDCDVLVGVFWARMGSPLPVARYQKSDGSAYQSGTEYEIADALNSDFNTDVLLYRRRTEPQWGGRDPTLESRREQLLRLDAYLDSLKARGHHVDEYEAPSDYAERLKNDLRQVLARRNAVSPTLAPSMKLLRDHVSLSYDGATYHIVFLKTIQAMSPNPPKWIYARIDANVFPHDLDLSHFYYAKYPISLDEMQFRAYTADGVPLRHTILQRYPSNIELAIRLQERDTGVPLSVLADQSITVIHEVHPSHLQWGPWLQREVRHHIDMLKVDMTFPAGLVDMKGLEMEGGEPHALRQPLVINRGAETDMWSWCVKTPPFHRRYRFIWKFRDKRETIFEEETRTALARLRKNIRSGRKIGTPERNRT